MKIGFCNELFEDRGLAATCRALKGLGYDGVELAPFTLAPLITDVSPDRLREVRSTIEGEGLEAIGFHWLLARVPGVHLTNQEPEVRRRTARYLVALAEATAAIGGSVLVFGSPMQRDRLRGVDPAMAMDFAAEVFRSAMPGVEACGVDLCVEPLGARDTNFLNSIAEADDLIARVDSPRFKLHMDVKAQSTDPGGSLPDLIAANAPRAGHFHVQDPDGRGPGMGPLDFGPVLDAIRSSGYDRWVSVEVFDAAGSIDETARRSIDCLRAGLG